MATESGREIALRIDTAHQLGRLSDKAVDALSKASLPTNLDLGKSAKEVYRDEVLLVTLMPDDSTSLNRFVQKRPSPRYSYRPMLEGEVSNTPTPYDFEIVEPDDPRSNAEAIRLGHNAVLDALAASPNPDQIQIATRYLNGFLLNPYGPLSVAKRLDTRNFRPNQGTPLYEQAVELLKMVLAKYEEYDADYKTVRTATLLVTDGRDEHSRKWIQTASSVAEVIRSMRGLGHHIVAAMGIEDGETDFRKVFEDMGIDPKWILTTGSTQKEIQQAFGVFAEAASKATVTADFQKLLNSGFGEITKT